MFCMQLKKSESVHRKQTTYQKILIMEMYMVIVLFVLGALVMDGNNVSACFCPKTHPQTDFCHLSSFSLVGYVSDVENSKHERRFRVIIHHLMKAPEEFLGEKEIQLISHKGQSLCEADFTPGITYLITGYVNTDNEYLVNSCLWTEDFTSLSHNKFSGLLGDYDCSCYINETWELLPSQVTSRDVCNYDKTNPCELAACLRNEEGTCEWILDCFDQKRATLDVLALKRKIHKELNEIL
ncbi:metalloproteinase inhibitor 4-like [Ylistrum balloti]|uniref:metalloproteinase inhibitor 4-like n=1 Tax=Ylistrum balloti TaxID=509963 RepID=UPI0029058442|nr:metalloproteinase inhibitor 4-like [Ylistrum balloti]